MAAASLGCADGGGGGTQAPPTGPLAHAGCGYVPLNQSLSGALSGSDPQGRPLTYSIVDQPARGAVQLTDPLSGRFTYTPDRDARGTDSFSFRVHNGSVYSGAAAYRLVFTPRVMPLGDSITLGLTGGGQPPPERRVSYRRALFDGLAAAGYVIDFVGTQTNGAAAGLADPHHEGHPGWCDDNRPFCSVSGGQNVDDNIAALLDAGRPDVVLLHIGTNHHSADASGMNSLLDRISAWAGANFAVAVFVVRIIPDRDEPLLNVSEFNNAVAGVLAPRPNLAILVVDQQAALAVAGDPNRADPALMADDLHPNEAGYARMAARWQERLLASGVLPRCP